MTHNTAETTLYPNPTLQDLGNVSQGLYSLILSSTARDEKERSEEKICVFRMF